MTKVALRDVVDVTGGGTPKKSAPEYYGGGIPWVTPKDMKRRLVGASQVTLTDGGVRNSPAKLVPEGSTLVVVRSGVLKHTLPVALTTRPVTVNQDMKALTPRANLDPSYLARLVKALQPSVLSWVRATTADNFPIDNLLDVEIELPPLPEQRRIAAILDHADALRAKRRQVLTHLDALTQAIFNDMFGEITPEGTVGDVAQIQGGLQVSAKRATLPVEVPYLRVANVYRGWLDLSTVKTLHATPAEVARTTLAAGDLLFVEGHANPLEVGRVATWTGAVDPCVHQNHLIRARLDPTRALPVFAESWLNSARGAAHFRRAGRTTSGLNTISASVVRAAPLPLPPIPLQHEFAARVDAKNNQWAASRRALAAADELFASLQSRAFRGEL